MIWLALPDLPETLLAEVTQGKLLMRVVGAGADHAVPVDRGMVPEMFARVAFAADASARGVAAEAPEPVVLWQKIIVLPGFDVGGIRVLGGGVERLEG